MAVAVEMSFTGPKSTLAVYDESIERMGAVPQGAHPDPDCLFHWAADTPQGYRVTDVWTSQAKFEAFAESTLGPLAQELDVPLPAPGQIKFIELHNYLTASSS